MSVKHTGLFVVGCSNTPWEGLPSLAGVYKDTGKIWDAFVEGRGRQGLANRPSSRSLIDENSRTVREQFESFLNNFDDRDALVIFYFVGHGALLGAGDVRMLFTDSQKQEPFTTTLSASEIIKMLQNKGVAEWAMVLDCCWAGDVLRDPASIGAQQYPHQHSLIVCATGMDNAWETSEGGGLLTRYLTEAISTGICVPPGQDFVDLVRAALWAQEQIKNKHAELYAVPQFHLQGSPALRVARTPPSEPLQTSTYVESVLFLGGKPEGAGDDDGQLLVNSCAIIGRILAETGIKLYICSPWSKSADYHVALGYASSRRATAINLFMPEGESTRKNILSLKNALDNDRVHLEEFWFPVVGKTELSVETWQYCQNHALEKADAVIALGGLTGRSASYLLRLAEARGVPVLPFTFLGGAANEAFQRQKALFNRLGVEEILTHRNGVEHLPELLRTLALSRIDPLAKVRKVFISRAIEDAAFAESFARQLSGKGIDPVFGDTPKEHGRDPQSIIHERLRYVDVCAIFWSRHFAVSPHCYDELAIALRRHREEGLRIWLLRLDGTPVVHADARRLVSWHMPTKQALEDWCKGWLDKLTDQEKPSGSTEHE